MLERATMLWKLEGTASYYSVCWSGRSYTVGLLILVGRRRCRGMACWNAAFVAPRWRFRAPGVCQGHTTSTAARCHPSTVHLMCFSCLGTASWSASRYFAHFSYLWLHFQWWNHSMKYDWTRSRKNACITVQLVWYACLDIANSL